MKKIVAVLFAIGLIMGFRAQAQLIAYSEPDRDDARDTAFVLKELGITK